MTRRAAPSALAALAALGALAAPSTAPAQASASPFTNAQRYDAMGRVTGTISASPGDGNPFLAVRNSYNAAGQLIRVETGSLSAWQSEAVAPASWNGFTVYRTLEAQYDAMSRKTRETLREGAAGAIRSFTQLSYDIMGRLDCTAVRMNPAQFAALPDSAACTPGTAGSDGPDRITKSIYDAAGQRIQLREGVGTNDAAAEATWRYNLDGQVTEVIDGNGNRAVLCYDGQGRQSRWLFPSPDRPPNFLYDPVETALVTAGAANGACTGTGGDFESYGYDPNGNRASLRRRDGSVLTYQYDALNRMTVKVVPERAGLTPAQTRDVHYGYDLRNLQLYARFDGATGPGVTSLFDGFGRLVSTTADTDGVARTLAYQHDANGSRTRITHPDTNWFVTVRDGLGRPFWLESVDNAACYYSSYRPDGSPGSQSRCNGSATWVSRDALGRLNGLGHYYGTGGANDVTWLYDHNPASQIRSVNRDNDSYAWTGHYAVDRAYSTNGLNQYTVAVSTLGSATFGYDLNGNLAATPGPNGQTITYTYDVENRLVAASTGAQLAYDPLGRLYQITASNGTVTRFLYDGDALVAEYNAAGEMTRRYIHWDGADVPVMSYDGPTLTTPRYLHPDHQGSIVTISSASGAGQINRYDEHGIPAATNGGRFQYTGQAWLAELGLYYYKARLYSPTLGRFLQTDPIGYTDQFNLYEYVGDDPVNRADPSGLESCPAGQTCPDIPAAPDSVRAAAIAALQQMPIGEGNRETAAQIMVDRQDPSRVTETRTGTAAGTRDPDNPMRVQMNPIRNSDRYKLGGDAHQHPRQGLRGERNLALRAAQDRVNNRNLYPSRDDFRHMNQTNAPMFNRNTAGAITETYRVDNVDHVRVLVPGNVPLGPVPPDVSNVVVDP